MLEHSQLSRLLSGKNDPLWICSIPDKARKALGCSTGAVYLSRESAAHILNKHNDIDDFQILLLPIAIQKGEIMIESNNRKFINCVYENIDKKIFFVAMKIAGGGHELRVSSMYEITKNKLRKKMNKSVVL